MSHYTNVDREFFQNILASAFTIQQHLEIKRFTGEGSNTIEVADDPFHDQITLPGLEEEDQSYATGAPTEEGAPQGVGVFADSMETSEAPGCDDPAAATGGTPEPGNDLPTAAEILDSCFPSFRVCQPELKTARLRPLDLWMPLQFILLVALALLLGWMLSRLSSRRIADKKGSTLVSARQDAVTAQPDNNSQAEQRSQPPVSRKPRGPEAPADSLVVYDRGRVIFRLKQGEDADFPHAKSGESLPQAHGSLQPTTVRLVRRVEPEYPEAARQQHLEGSVVLEAVVAEDGTVEQLSVISGNSLLASAASNAVRQWQFTPLVQNGEAVRFQTRIKIDYALP
jgi:TonB family protein